MPHLYGVQDVARQLSISEWTVRGLLRKRKLMPTRIGRRLLVSEAELQRFVDECQAVPLDAQREVEE